MSVIIDKLNVFPLQAKKANVGVELHLQLFLTSELD
jgi:hypothetical protein